MAGNAKRAGAPVREESLASDFGRIFEAIADAFRGLGRNDQLECRCEKLHYAGWR